MSQQQDEGQKAQQQQQVQAVEEIEKFPEFRKEQVDGVFIDFSPEGALQKLINLSKCPFNERLTYTKHLADLLQLIGEQGNIHLKSIIDFIIGDNDDIKRTLLVQLPFVIEHLKAESYGYEIMRDIITPALFSLIGNENLDIKEDSGKILAQIGDIMNTDDRGKYILTKVLNMAHDDQIDDNRIVAIQLLTQMAHCFGAELCQQFVGLEILSLGEDPQLRVRKESVLNLPTIGTVVSQEFFQQRLLPFYIQKSLDPFWGIRKACVEILVDISNVCTQKVKENELTELLLNCLKDQSKWVKMAAYKILGPFIVTLEKCHPSEKLFEHYTKMTDPTVNSLSNENEILIVCAQYFPAVLTVFKEKKWPQLSKTFQFLLKSNIKKVKKPIACSLHVIAELLGPEKAEKDLFNILDQILKDNSDEVKYGAISNLAGFMKVFDSQKRENFLDVFLILQKDPKKWRIRELIARQIDLLASMFNSETVFRYIMPISFKLCNDTVSIVREEAAKKIHSILLQFVSGRDPSDEIYLGYVVENIRAFSISNRFNQRQTFILMCNQLMMYPEIFKKSFIDICTTLASDKVVNVRISLAHTIASHIKAKGPLSDDDEIKKIIEILKQDKSRDVRSHFIQVEDYVKSKETSKQQVEGDSQKNKEVVANGTHKNGESKEKTPTNGEYKKQEEKKKLLEEEAAKKKQAEKDEINRKNQEAAQKLAEEEQKKQAQKDKEEAEKKENEEKVKQLAAEEEAKKKQQEEEDAKKKAEEEVEEKRQAQEKADQLKAEELKQQQDEETQQKQQKEETQKSEEEANNQGAEEKQEQSEESEQTQGDSSANLSIGDSSSTQQEEAALVEKEENKTE